MDALGRFVQCDADVIGIHDAQVDSDLPRPGCDSPCLAVGIDGQGVKIHVMNNVVTESAKAFRGDLSVAVYSCRDVPQSLRSVIHRIERCHNRQQNLGGADVAGRLVSADVLLAGLQRHTQCRFAARVN